jgi:hypothetical protein
MRLFGALILAGSYYAFFIKQRGNQCGFIVLNKHPEPMPSVLAPFLLLNG